MEIKRYLIYIPALIILIVSLMYDEEILNLIIQNRIPFLNIIMIWTTYIGHQLSVFLISTILILYKNYKKILTLWITLVITTLITYALKYTIQRPRPLVDTLIQTSGYAFPSGHTTFIFSTIPLITKEFPKLKYLWIIFAFLVLFSRLYLGVHFPSDVIIGAIFGYLIGIIITYIQKPPIK